MTNLSAVRADQAEQTCDLPGTSDFGPTIWSRAIAAPLLGREGALFFRAQFRVVFANKCSYLRSTRQDAQPLFLVERDRKLAYPVHTNSAFLTQLQNDTALVFVLELGILGPQVLQLRKPVRLMPTKNREQLLHL